MFNDHFRIEFWNDYFYLAHRDRLERDMPLFLRNAGGSLWLRKVL
jgi:hypothetical protein